jgi:hypothetical protein
MDRAIRRALARRPDDRVGSPLELVDALERPPPARARRAAAIAATTAIAAAAATAAAVVAFRPGPAPSPPRSAFTFGGPGWENLDAVATLGDDLIVAGKGNHGARLIDHAVPFEPGDHRQSVVARIAPDGRLRWVSVLSGPEQVSVCTLDVAPDGTVVIGGWARGPVPALDVEVGGLAGSFVAALDGDSGTVRWSRSVTATGHASARAVRVDAAGAVFVVGEASGHVVSGRVEPRKSGPAGSPAPPPAIPAAGKGSARRSSPRSSPAARCAGRTSRAALATRACSGSPSPASRCTSAEE